MSHKPVILYDSGSLTGLSGTADGQGLKWDDTAKEWVASAITQDQVEGLTTALNGKVNTTTSVSAGAGLKGGGTLAESRTIELQDRSTSATPPGLLIPATYGAADKVSQFTVDQYGITTYAADVSIQIAENQVTDLTTHLNDKVPTTRSVNTTSGQLTGGGTLSADLTLGLAEITPAINGEKGSATAIPVLTVDAYGRITASTNTTVTLAGDVTGDVTASTVAKIQGRDV